MRAVGGIDPALKLVWTLVDEEQGRHELRSGNDLVATLTREPAFRGGAVGETVEGKLHFRKRGFLFPGAVVLNGEREVASLQSNWKGGGSLSIRTGRTFSLAYSNLLTTRCSFLDGGDQPLVRCEAVVYPAGAFPLLRTSGEMTWRADAPSMSDLPLLLLLGWYRVIAW